MTVPVDLDRFGLAVWQGEVRSMEDAHRHHEVELNVLTAGAVTYLFGGESVRLTDDRLLIFWGALPHRLVAYDQGTRCIWLTLPLALFLRFGLPEALTSRVLSGGAVLEPDARSDDARLLGRWLEDAQLFGDESTRILELELEARLRRLACSLTRTSEPAPRSISPSDLAGDITRAAELAAFISEHYLEPLTLADVARAAALNPTYAATLFRRTFGMTVFEYLNRHRLAHAQRLLVTTDQGVLEVALEAGFGSSSRFYTVFKEACGETPKRYRKRVRSR